jgi:hypothetical protein
MLESSTLQIIFRIRTQTEFEAMKNWLESSPLISSLNVSDSSNSYFEESLPLLNPESDFVYDLSANGLSLDENYRRTNPYPFIDINTLFDVQEKDLLKFYTYCKRIPRNVKSIILRNGILNKYSRYERLTTTEFEARLDEYPFVKV